MTCSSIFLKSITGKAEEHGRKGFWSSSFIPGIKYNSKKPVPNAKSYHHSGSRNEKVIRAKNVKNIYISRKEKINKKISRLSFVFTWAVDPFDQVTSFPFDSYLQHKLNENK